MLAFLDRRMKAWHMWVAAGAGIAWFAGMTLATQAALPGVKLFRCPIGLCPGYYLPNELNATLTRIGKTGRDFLAETLLPLDMVLPALLLVAFIAVYIWFSRPGEAFAVPLSPGSRRALLCVPFSYCAADYGENFALVEALRTYPNIPYWLARRASFLTATKSQLITASVGIAVALAIAAWGRGRADGSSFPPSEALSGNPEANSRDKDWG
jgi:hypothetical protein